MNPANHPTNRSRSSSSSARKSSLTSPSSGPFAAAATAIALELPATAAVVATARQTSDMTDASAMTTGTRARSQTTVQPSTVPSFTFTFNPSQASQATRTVQAISTATLHHAPSYSSKSSRHGDTSSRRSSASDQSSFSQTPYSTGVPLKTKRKLRKNNREKQRRSELNDKVRPIHT